MISMMKLSFSVAVVLTQMHLLVTAYSHFEMSVRKPAPVPSLCGVDSTVTLTDSTLSVNLFLDKSNKEAIKSAVPSIVSRIAQEFVYDGYDSTDDTFKQPCSQMYYMLGNAISYDLLSGAVKPTPADTERLQAVYQKASDIAFEGTMTQAQTEVENAVNKEAFKTLTAEDCINLYNGNLVSSEFFKKFLDALDVIKGDPEVIEDFKGAFTSEKNFFSKTQDVYKEFYKQIKQLLEN